MENSLVNLLISGAIALFLGSFVTIWLWQTNKTKAGTFSLPLRQYRALMRLAKFGKVPTLCGTHAALLIVKPGKMAVLDGANCEVCTKRSKLI